MVFFDIGPTETKKLDTFLRLASKPRAKLFLLFYMEGCGPCNQTRPLWKELESDLPRAFQSTPHILIASLDKDWEDQLKEHVRGPKLTAFPTMRYIYQGKSKDYTGERTTEALSDWILSHSEPSRSFKQSLGGSKRKRTRKRRTKGRHGKKKHTVRFSRKIMRYFI